MRTDPGTVQPKDSLYVDLSTNAGSSFTTIDSFGPGSGGWDMKTITFSSVSATTIIRFRASAKFTGFTDIGLDSVTVSATTASEIGRVYPGTTSNATFSIYPNPTKGTINVYTAKGGSLEIMDMPGRCVQKINLPVAGNVLVTLSPNLTSGMYTYKYRVNGVLSHTGKLVIAL
jgi:hypothetical protein